MELHLLTLPSCRKLNRLTTESVKGSSLSLQRVDNIKRRNGLALGVLGVGDRVTNHTFEEALEDGSGLLIDESRDTLDTTTTS
jgi:hypothetical protein